ncbi:uncharacterized protein [Struthio camelus]|uniref:uncharacterized protein n=1 Tax=Struthio camelus TaxID=8801 RepID=UPI003604291C
MDAGSARGLPGLRPWGPDLDTEKQPGLARLWAKEHCNHILDSINAQLSQVQWQGHGVQVMGSSRDHDISSDTSLNVSWPAGLEEYPASKAGYLQGEANPLQKEDCWRVAHLLDSQSSLEQSGAQSSSSSICTEDFAARFQESMVEPLLFSEDEEDEPFSVGSGCTRDVPAVGNGNSFPAEEHDTGQDEFLLSTGRRQDVPQQLEVELGCLLQSTFPSLMRRESLESLGERISRLSRSNAVMAGMEPASFPEWWAPIPAPAKQVSVGQKDSSRWAPCSGEGPLDSTLSGDEPSAGYSQRVADTSTSRTQAWDREPQSTRRTQSLSKMVDWHSSPESSWATTTAPSGPSLPSKQGLSPELVPSPCPCLRWSPESNLLGQGWTLQGANERGCSTRCAGVPVPPASISAGSSLPGYDGAGTRWHPMSRPVRLRQRESSALWGQSGGDVSLAVADADVEGAGDRLRRARSWAHCTNPGARSPRVYSLHSSRDGGPLDTSKDPSSCGSSHWWNSGAEGSTWSPGKVAKPCWERSRLEASLTNKCAGREPASLYWSLQRNWKGVQELESCAKKTQSKGDRARYAGAFRD